MRRHNQRLFRLARSVVGDESEAEDVVQSAYLRAYSALSGFRGDAGVLTWLTRITLHEALRVRRVRQRAPQVTVDASVPPSESEEPSPLDRIHTEEQRTALAEAFDTLPTAQRMVVMMRLVEGRSTRETAETLRRSEVNIKVQLHRARQQLADALQRRGIEHLRDHFTFAGDRCDRIVRQVFARIGDGSSSPRPRSSFVPPLR